ncbi:MAG: small multi-drug export protein [Candidatus Omnitrophica bacterium]|nr:small multi-drug export protein [Candidatus Omnitrophota bacterium]MDD5311168.1 small multi-drug export protein [Candidatus Omnitrophota bacterium]MDD5547194.1 small multi-drug export protein [Candidatus Omnitrophota bacterium]
MVENLILWMNGLPKDIVVLVIAMLPVSELRGAIPAALSFGIPVQKAFIISVIGNFIPVIPVLFLLEPVSKRLSRFKPFARFFDWLFTRTLKKTDTIQKYEMWGLAIFVAIPLPMTGAWSGAIAASLLKMKFRYAVAGCILGIITAGIIVSLLCVSVGLK